MTFTIRQGDTAPPISSRLSDEDGYVDLTEASNVRFHLQDKFQRVVIEDDLTGRVNIVDEDLGEVEYVFSPRDTTDVGSYTGEWEVLYEDGKVETFPVEGNVDVKITEQVQ